MERSIRFDVTIIGHFAKDRLVFREGDTVVEERTSPGGAVYYGGIALRRLGYTVAVVTRLREEDFPLLDELRAEGVHVFATPAEATSGIENVYQTADLDRRACRPLGFAGPFRPEEIPDVETRRFLVGPIMAGEVDLPLVKWLAGKAPLALDAQGFVRVREDGRLVFRDWPEKREGLACVDVLKVDSAEAEVLTGEADPSRAVRALAEYGPREVVLTLPHGVWVHAEGRDYEAPFTPRRVRGRTGRGDTCFAAYLGKRLEASPEEACRFAAKVTSRKLEEPGPFRGFE